MADTCVLPEVSSMSEKRFIKNAATVEHRYLSTCPTVVANANSLSTFICAILLKGDNVAVTWRNLGVGPEACVHSQTNIRIRRSRFVKSRTEEGDHSD